LEAAIGIEPMNKDLAEIISYRSEKNRKAKEVTSQTLKFLTCIFFCYSGDAGDTTFFTTL